MATNTNPSSRKRPAPTQPPPPPSSNNNVASTSLRIDALLAKYARNLPPGGTITIQLIKGGSISSVDPIAVRKAAAKKERQLQRSSQESQARLVKSIAGMMISGMSSGNDSDGGGASSSSAAASAAAKAAAISAAEKLTLTFPRIAKFPETVSKPDFYTGGLRDGRMYEEEVPLAKDESDEDEATSYRSPEDGSGGPPKKKKRRWRRHDARPRRWVVQEKAEFFERIAAKRRKQQAGLSGDDNDEGGNKLSNQYHGVVESNASKYVMLSVLPSSSAASIPTPPPQTGSSNVVASEQITIQPIFGFHTFSQPYKTASLSMEDAEAAIEKQRNTVTRYMMHGKLSSDKNEAAAAIASGVRGGRRMGPAPKALSRARLLGKLAGGDDIDDEDDVMGDIKFETRRGGGRARKELISSMADEGTTMDDDGVLGGANDVEFGGKRRFGRAAVEKSAEASSSDKKGGGAAATGFEAGAMEEGFYQRDVSAEYEALDYDANEQFDDDDVNLGEDEIMDDGGGFAGDFDSEDDLMSEDEASDDGLGMATTAGLKAMLAKARGESPVNEVADGAAPDAIAASQSSNVIEDNTKKPAGVEQSNGTSASKPQPAATKPIAKEAVGVEIGADGMRKITLESVRREIWLNSGSIKTTKLMKKFDVTKEFPARQAVFKKIVMELCTMKKDADGNKLVLKQHYSK